MGVNHTFACYREDSVGIYLYCSIVLVSIIIIVKNICIIILTCRAEERQKNVNIMFASMAISELLLAVALIFYQVETIPFFKLYALWTNTAVCFVFGVGYGNILISFTHMGVVALDRYIHILHPIYYMNFVTRRSIVVTLLCLWIGGLTFMIIPISVYTDDKYHEKCIIMHPPIVYFAAESCLYVVILIATCISYFKIARFAFQRRKAANARSMNTDNVSDCRIFRLNQISAFRSVKFFILMFGILAICTFPIVVILWLGFVYNLSDTVLSTIFFLVPTYSVMNTLIYVKMNRDFYRLIQSNCCIPRRCCFKLKGSTEASG